MEESGQAGEGLVQELGEESAEEAGEESAEEAGEESAEGAGADSGDEPGEEAAEEAGEDPGDEPGEEAGQVEWAPLRRPSTTSGLTPLRFNALEYAGAESVDDIAPADRAVLTQVEAAPAGPYRLYGRRMQPVVASRAHGLLVKCHHVDPCPCYRGAAKYEGLYRNTRVSPSTIRQDHHLKPWSGTNVRMTNTLAPCKFAASNYQQWWNHTSHIARRWSDRSYGLDFVNVDKEVPHTYAAHVLGRPALDRVLDAARQALPAGSTEGWLLEGEMLMAVHCEVFRFASTHRPECGLPPATRGGGARAAAPPAEHVPLATPQPAEGAERSPLAAGAAAGPSSGAGPSTPTAVPTGGPVWTPPQLQPPAGGGSNKRAAGAGAPPGRRDGAAGDLGQGPPAKRPHTGLRAGRTGLTPPPEVDVNDTLNKDVQPLLGAAPSQGPAPRAAPAPTPTPAAAAATAAAVDLTAALISPGADGSADRDQDLDAAFGAGADQQQALRRAVVARLSSYREQLAAATRAAGEQQRAHQQLLEEAHRTWELRMEAERGTAALQRSELEGRAAAAERTAAERQQRLEHQERAAQEAAARERELQERLAQAEQRAEAAEGRVTAAAERERGLIAARDAAEGRERSTASKIASLEGQLRAAAGQMEEHVRAAKEVAAKTARAHEDYLTEVRQAERQRLQEARRKHEEEVAALRRAHGEEVAGVREENKAEREAWEKERAAQQEKIAELEEDMAGFRAVFDRRKGRG